MNDGLLTDIMVIFLALAAANAIAANYTAYM
jgi:hypothetical protein